MLSNRVGQINVQTRFIVDKNTWPPEQVKCYTPLILIHHQGHCTADQVTAMAELMYTDNIDMVSHSQSTIRHHKSRRHSCENFQSPCVQT